IQLDCVELLRVKVEHFSRRNLCWIKWTSPVFVVISGCTDANVTLHEQARISQLLPRERRFFLATEDACLPSAVRTDFGRWAIVRFRFAADAAFLMFFFAAFLCLVEAIFTPRHPISRHLIESPAETVAVFWMTILAPGVCL